MTTDELYDHITSQMTPEAALKKLLEANLLTYEKLKFNEGEEVHPLILIASASMDMGWQIAVEQDNETVRGVTVGTKEYMDMLFK